MAEIDRVYTVEATGITPQRIAAPFLTTKGTLCTGCGTLPQLAVPTHRQRYPHTAGGTFIQQVAALIQQAVPSYSRWQHPQHIQQQKNGTQPSRNSHSRKIGQLQRPFTKQDCTSHFNRQELRPHLQEDSTLDKVTMECK
jgi:hypothetical protein